MTKEKDALIKNVRETLKPELQPLFDEYCKKRNRYLIGYLQDDKTEWSKILNKWKESKDKKPATNKSIIKKCNKLIEDIQKEQETDTFESLTEAKNLCSELVKIFESRQSSKKQDKIKAIKDEIEERQKMLDELESN